MSPAGQVTGSSVVCSGRKHQGSLAQAAAALTAPATTVPTRCTGALRAPSAGGQALGRCHGEEETAAEHRHRSDEKGVAAHHVHG
jgi:hypothetical protein